MECCDMIITQIMTSVAPNKAKVEDNAETDSMLW